MKQFRLSVMITLLLIGAGLSAQGPLTNLLNLRGRTDAGGSLLTKPSAYTGPDGPLTSLSNLRVRTDSNGYLLTTTSTTGGANFYASNGTLSLPSYSFVNDTATGMYLNAASDLRFTVGGGDQFRLFGNGGMFRSDAILGFANSTALTTIDTALSRTATGVVAVGTGAQGSTAGSIALTGMVYTATAFGSLGTPTNGTVLYCNDCTVTTAATCPATQASCICAGSGTGAIARRINSVWYCTF